MAGRDSAWEVEEVSASGDAVTCNNVSLSEKNDSEWEKNRDTAEQEESVVSDNLSTSQSADANETTKSGKNEDTSTSSPCEVLLMKGTCCAVARFHVKEMTWKMIMSQIMCLLLGQLAGVLIFILWRKSIYFWMKLKDLKIRKRERLLQRH